MGEGDDVFWLRAWIEGGSFLRFEVSVDLAYANNNNMQSLLLTDMVVMMWQSRSGVVEVWLLWLRRN